MEYLAQSLGHVGAQQTCGGGGGGRKRVMGDLSVAIIFFWFQYSSCGSPNSSYTSYIDSCFDLDSHPTSPFRSISCAPASSL